MKKVVVFAVLVMVLVLLVSCAAQAQSATTDAQRIVGTWTGQGILWVFNANGTGTAGGDNFTFGISANGSIFVSLFGSQQLFMSPDGRRMFIGSAEFTRN